MVGKDQWGSTGSPFTAIDGDKVHCPPTVCHRMPKLMPEFQIAHCRLYANRQPSLIPQHLHKVEQAVHIVKGSVCGRADAILPHGDAANGSNFGRDLGCGQHATQSRLGTLAEFNLNRLDLWAGLNAVEQFGQAKATIRLAAAEIPCPHLPDHIRTV